MFVEIETDKLMYTIKRERHTFPPAPSRDEERK